MYSIPGFTDRTRHPSISSRVPSVTIATQFVRQKSKSHYDVLGVQSTASPDDIRKAFLELSKQLHPDVNKHDPKTHEKFVQVNEAYTILSKSPARREYDLNLARRVYNQQHAGQSVYGSHVHANSHRPGSNFEQGEGEERIFWDETIWYMRDRSKDKNYEKNSYYGFRGMKRLPNSYILGGCFGFMVIGAFIHYVAVSKSTAMHKRVLDAKDMKYHAIYSTAKTQAKIHGNDLQLKILKAHVLKKEQENDVLSGKKG